MITQQPDVIFLNIETQRAIDDARYTEKLATLGIPVVYVDFRHTPMENTEPTSKLLKSMESEATEQSLIVKLVGTPHLARTAPTPC